MPTPNHQLSKLLTEQIAAGDFPAAVYAAANRDDIIFTDALGYTVRTLSSRKSTRHYLRPASLTKPLVTGLLCSCRIEHEPTLDSSVSHYCLV